MYTFRPHTDNDFAFIQSSWGRSYYEGAGYRRFQFPKEFHERHRPIREAFFKRSSAQVIVCVSKDNPDVIIGWLAYEMNPEWKYTLLHYVYVKQAFKGFKLASQLLAQMKTKDPILFTHLTDKADRIMYKKRYPNYYFAPHLT